MTLADVWAAAQVNSLWVPRVSITLVSEKLARKIGALGLNFWLVLEGSEDTKSESECKKDEVVSAAYSIPDKDQFLLLHSIFSLNHGHNLLN
jgi:hypothetical protein